MTREDRIAVYRAIMGPIGMDDLSIVDRLVHIGFFDAPASTKYHGAYDGGLFGHSVIVAKTLEKLTRDNSLHWERKESPLIIGMFHDICKADMYRHPKTGFQVTDISGKVIDEEEYCKWEHNPDCFLKGHGDKSVMVLSTFFSLTMEEVLCIRYHMGAFTDQKEWQDYTNAIHVCPNVLWTHHADMIAAHIKEVSI